MEAEEVATQMEARSFADLSAASRTLEAGQPSPATSPLPHNSRHAGKPRAGTERARLPREAQPAGTGQRRGRPAQRGGSGGELFRSFPEFTSHVGLLSH